MLHSFFFLLSLSATVLLRCCKVRLYDKQGINKALQPLSIWRGELKKHHAENATHLRIKWQQADERAHHQRDKSIPLNSHSKHSDINKVCFPGLI